MVTRLVPAALMAAFIVGCGDAVVTNAPAPQPSRRPTDVELGSKKTPDGRSIIVPGQVSPDRPGSTGSTTPGGN